MAQFWLRGMLLVLVMSLSGELAAQNIVMPTPPPQNPATPLPPGGTTPPSVTTPPPIVIAPPPPPAVATPSLAPVQPAPAPKPPNILGIELPINTLSTSNLVKRAGGTVVPLTDLMSDRGIIVTFKVLNDTNVKYLEERFGLKAETVEGLPPNARFMSFASATIPDAVVSTINRIMGDQQTDFVQSASPLFLFDDGAVYAQDMLVIEWDSHVPKSRALAIVGRMGLGVVTYDEATGVMVVKTTSITGWNVFRLAYLCGPENGNPFAISVEPFWMHLVPPLAVSAHIEPGNPSGFAGDIVGSQFRFVLEVRAQKNVSIKVDELRATSAELRNWFPRRVGKKNTLEPVSSQIFDLEGPEVIAPSTVGADGATTTVITYKFRVSQAGVFRMKPPKVFYEHFDAQLKKKTSSEYVGGTSVEFMVGSILPGEAGMVNDVVQRETPRIESNALAKAELAKNIAFALMAFGGSIFLYVAGVAVLAFARKDRTTAVRTFSPIARWEHAAPSMLAHLPDAPLQFWASFAQELRAVLGLYANKDECAFETFTPDEAEHACVHAFSKETVREELFGMYRDAYEILHNAADNRRANFSRAEGEVLVESVRKNFIVAQSDRGGK